MSEYQQLALWDKELIRAECFRGKTPSFGERQLCLVLVQGGDVVLRHTAWEQALPPATLLSLPYSECLKGEDYCVLLMTFASAECAAALQQQLAQYTLTLSRRREIETLLVLCLTSQSTAVVMHLAAAVLAMLLSKEDEPDKRMPSQLKAVLTWLESNYAAADPVAQAAALFHYNRSYLCRMVREQTGQTFRQHLQTLRLHRAAELLSTTHATVADIADQTGYRDPQRFYAHFKRFAGVTPGQYRAIHYKGVIAHETGLSAPWT